VQRIKGIFVVVFEFLGIMPEDEKVVGTFAEYVRKPHEVTEKICVAKIDSWSET